jgi:two-component system, cell cycle sensor histidine kinase and response regulator CckA
VRESEHTILVVDDEQGVRDLVSRMLAMGGYSVLQAESGDGALRILAAHAGAVALLITDVRMPEMDGIELAEHVRQQYPAVKLIYMTGFSEHVLSEGHAVLRKPFTVARLLAEVNRVLSQ